MAHGWEIVRQDSPTLSGVVAVAIGGYNWETVGRPRRQIAVHSWLSQKETYAFLFIAERREFDLWPLF